jgi:hypothetical protein
MARKLQPRWGALLAATNYLIGSVCDGLGLLSIVVAGAATNIFGGKTSIITREKQAKVKSQTGGKTMTPQLSKRVISRHCHYPSELQSR